MGPESFKSILSEEAYLSEESVKKPLMSIMKIRTKNSRLKLMTFIKPLEIHQKILKYPQIK